MIGGGGAVWLLGRPFSIHVGASGVVFGYLGFLLARGFFERSMQAVVLCILAFVLYGGAIWGVIPTTGRISWESHLFGALAGMMAARYLTRRSPTRAPR
jgi:membrane associated rhomboid family serine protease